MSKTVIIPNTEKPFVTIRINDDVYRYPSGTEQTVPDEVADLLATNEWNTPYNEEEQLPEYYTELDTKIKALESDLSDAEDDIDALEQAQRTYYTITVTAAGNITDADIDAPADIEEGGVALIGVDVAVEEESCSATGASMVTIVNDASGAVFAIFNPTGNVTVTLSDEA